MMFNTLMYLLKSSKDVNAIERHRDVILRYFPCLEKTIEFDQYHPAHQYNLWEHTLHTVVNLPKNIGDSMLYLAALLHDIGKTSCQTFETLASGETIAHYYGHPLKSTELVACEILPGLQARNIHFMQRDVKRLLYYVEHHDDEVNLDLGKVKQHAALVGLSVFKKLMMLEIADAEAHVCLPCIEKRINICTELLEGKAEILYRQAHSNS